MRFGRTIRGYLRRGWACAGFFSVAALAWRLRRLTACRIGLAPPCPRLPLLAARSRATDSVADLGAEPQPFAIDGRTGFDRRLVVHDGGQQRILAHEVDDLDVHSPSRVGNAFATPALMTCSPSHASSGSVSAEPRGGSGNRISWACGYGLSRRPAARPPGDKHFSGPAPTARAEPKSASPPCTTRQRLFLTDSTMVSRSSGTAAQIDHSCQAVSSAAACAT